MNRPQVVYFPTGRLVYFPSGVRMRGRCWSVLESRRMVGVSPSARSGYVEGNRWLFGPRRMRDIASARRMMFARTDQAHCGVSWF
jgi:hypothetical protein